MDKLFKMLARGEMPDFAQMLEALNSISDINWQAIEDAQLSFSDVLKAKCIPKYPAFCPGEFCESCG